MDATTELDARLDLIGLANDIVNRENDMITLLHKVGLIDDSERNRLRANAQYRASEAKRLAITPFATVQANTGLHRRRALAELGED